MTLISCKSKLSPKCVKIARPTLFGYIETRDEFEYYVNELFTLLQSGQLKVKVHKVYPLEQVAQAHIVRIHRVPSFLTALLTSVPLTGSRGAEDHWKATSEALNLECKLDT